MSIPAYLTMPSQNGLTFGKQAFDDWADSLTDGRFADVPASDLDVWKIHGTYLCNCGTNGCSRGGLAKALQLTPDMRIIADLQPLFERNQQLFEQLTVMEGGFTITPEQVKNPEIMRPISRKIREFSDCCDEILHVFSSFH